MTTPTAPHEGIIALLPLTSVLTVQMHTGRVVCFRNNHGFNVHVTRRRRTCLSERLVSTTPAIVPR